MQAIWSTSCFFPFAPTIAATGHTRAHTVQPTQASEIE
jgi:hypothetical protein